MLGYFQRSEDLAKRSIQQPSDYIKLKGRLRREFIRVYHHNRENDYAVESNHFLVRLLDILSVDTDLPIFEYDRKVRDRLDRLTRAFDISTPTRAGKVTDQRLIYPEDYEQIPVYFEQSIDLLEIEKYYHRLQPVYIFRHSRNDLSWVDLASDEDRVQSGICVIGIDPRALAIQYKLWLDEYKRADYTHLPTKRQFVHTLPLTNALISHFDKAMFNRMYALFQGTRVFESQNPWPTFVRDYTKRVDDYLFDRIRYILDRPMGFDRMLESIGFVFHDDLYKLSRISKIALTRQNRWCYLIGLLPTIRFLLHFEYESSGTRNHRLNNDIRRSLREIEQDGSLLTYLPSETYFSVEQEIEKIKSFLQA